MNQVISNLLDNSCYWLSSSTSQRRIINVGVDADARTLTVADSGPDFDESIRPYLFEPGYSLKVPPSGLGLYICRFYMASMGGNAFEANKEDRFAEMDGAHIVLDFSKVPAEEVS